MDTAQRRHPRAKLWLRQLAPAAAFVLLIVGYFTLPLNRFGPAHPVLSWTSFGVALITLAVLLLAQIRKVLLTSDQGRPAAAIALLISLSLVIFASTYLALSHSPGQFNGLHTRVDALYFTLVTTATIGYGDINAAGQTARVVVLVQIFYNFVFLTAGASAFSRQLRGQVGSRMRHRAHPEPPDASGPPLD
ncbi:voltage-gated potassium channel [Kitasatospora sp. MAA4]|uniref:potassium channel family protein n=1 Tax=Kitasatospora sp. MAA4 TaxID=3035093 RepID=UPI002475F911|nr:potassium channel family protein [Kitasatospora sp. MAA4]MDH6134054.1 voltage-gated potassium channel [Kitasatospora sp. MAA4]